MVAGASRYSTEASSSRAGLPASGGPAASPERGQERVDAPLPHFADAQAEQQLWEELRDHDASLNRALNEALQIHGGPAWRVFRVRSYLLVFCVSSLLCCFYARFSLSGAHQSLFADGRSWRVTPGTGTALLTR
jgi:hypothetical protein